MAVFDFDIAVKTWRKRLGMTTREFADFVGLSQNTIFNIENGRVSPYLYTVSLIAEKLGVSLDELFLIDDKEI